VSFFLIGVGNITLLSGFGLATILVLGLGLGVGLGEGGVGSDCCFT